jgi:hypothetical protein
MTAEKNIKWRDFGAFTISRCIYHHHNSYLCYYCLETYLLLLYASHLPCLPHRQGIDSRSQMSHWLQGRLRLTSN